MSDDLPPTPADVPDGIDDDLGPFHRHPDGSLSLDPAGLAGRMFPDLDRLEVENKPLLQHLGDDEILDRGARMAELHRQRQEHQADTKRIKAERKREEAELTDEIERLARIVHTRQEERSVAVWTMADFETGEAVEVRQDTGEILYRRALTAAERQTTIHHLTGRATGKVTNLSDHRPRAGDDD